MIIKKEATIQSFIKDVAYHDLKIVVYGFGVIGKTVTPFFLEENGLSKRLLMYVDADPTKHGYNRICHRNIYVNSPNKLMDIDEPFIILVTSSRYDGILRWLEQQHYLDAIDVYILPIMLISEEPSDNGEVDNISQVPLIPKVIHYCWFGKGPLPEELKKYIDTWKDHCPDYEIVLWNENNYDVNKYTYTRQAYENKKWAFVSDVARLDILYEYGGIYLDTDVEIIKNFDELLYQKAFCGVEKWRVLNTGCCGTVKNHPIVYEMLRARQNISLVNSNGTVNTESSGVYDTLPLIEHGYIPNNRYQVIKDFAIYPSDFFHPYDYLTKKTKVTNNTYSIHHFYGSWN